PGRGPACRRRAEGGHRAPDLPALGQLRAAGAGRGLSGQAARREAGRGAFAAETRPSRRTLGGRARLRGGDGRQIRPEAAPRPVGLCAARFGAPARQSRRRAAGADRGADGRLPGRGRHRASCRRLQSRAGRCMPMTRKTALITGITGQDGAYLAELLLAKGYEVHGIKRRSSSFNTGRIDHLYQDPHTPDARLILHYGDMTDATNLIRIMQEVQPDEVYNLAAQSHVQVSFETAEYTANADALGTLRLLEAIRLLGLADKTRFYQASTSELFGKVREVPQSETTPFYPRSPYAAAKLYAY